MSGMNRGEPMDQKVNKSVLAPSLVTQSVISGPIDNRGAKKQQEMVMARLPKNVRLLLLHGSSFNDLHWFQLEDAMKQKLTLNLKLEQDSMEGVDECEWVRTELKIYMSFSDKKYMIR
jgi:hypothetical protein